MKARITEIETHAGYLGHSYKVTMIGYLKQYGSQVTVILDDDGTFAKDIANSLNDNEIELEIKIHTKQTTIKTHTLI